MLVYQTGTRGEFVGTVEADPNPLEPNKWLVPGGCVLEAPPQAPPGREAVWADGRWSFADIPKPPELPPLVNETPPPEPELPPIVVPDVPAQPEPTFEQNVNTVRGERFYAGCLVQLAADTAVALRGDAETTTNLLGRVSTASIMLSRGDTTTLAPWRDASDVVHMLSPEQFGTLQLGMTQYVDALYVASWDIKSGDEMLIDEIRGDSRWPSMYIDMVNL